MLSKIEKDIFKNQFFYGLSMEELLNIDISKINEIYFNKGDIILEQDTTGDFIYLISSGEVIISKIVSGREIELSRKKTGEYVGEMALFDDGHIRSANVIAATDVKMYIINYDLFFTLFNKFEEIKINIIKTINSTIRESGLKLGEKTVSHDMQISIKDFELSRTRSLLKETTELKRHIDEQKCELELINRELERKNRELYQLTIKDDLTNLYSYNHFMRILENELSRSFKYNFDLSLLLVDIDEFNSINTELGYFSGDKILKDIANIISGNIGCEDFAGRIDGDSFGIVLTHKNLSEAEEKTKVIKEQVTNLIINGLNRKISVSIGVVGNYTKNIKDATSLIEEARSILKIK